VTAPDTSVLLPPLDIRGGVHGAQDESGRGRPQDHRPCRRRPPRQTTDPLRRNSLRRAGRTGPAAETGQAVVSGTGTGGVVEGDTGS
jgi:hypothetical protein